MPRGNFLSTNQKHYQDLGSARRQYGISALVTQTSFCEGSSGDLAKRRLFSHSSTFFNLLISDLQKPAEPGVFSGDFVPLRTALVTS